MKFLRQVNARLGSATGFEIRRAGAARAGAGAKSAGAKAGSGSGSGSDAGAGASAEPHAPASRSPQVEFRPPQDPALDRLLRRPVFIVSPVRSGSTLLRLLLNAHSQLHAPHELHVRRLEVRHGTALGKRAMAALGLERGDLEHLLWDRVMHRELVASGKSVLVEKTPSNAFAYQRLATCWPDARFVFLLRHPASIARSWHEADPDKRDAQEATLDALRYMRAVERARKALTGHTVHYEALTDDPATVLRDLCAYLGVDYEPSMLDYGARDEGDLRKGLGDWKEKIRSGRVQGGRELPTPADVPEPLRDITAAWGYEASDRTAAGREPGAAHAEIAQVWPRDGRIRLVGEVRRCPGAPSEGWRLSLVLRGREDRERSYAARVEDGRFDVSVPVAELAPGTAPLPAVWDAYLTYGEDEDGDRDGGGATRLRLGRLLDDVGDKKKVMVFPAQPLRNTDDSGQILHIRPYYTVKHNLSVECSAAPDEDLSPSDPSSSSNEVQPAR